MKQKLSFFVILTMALMLPQKVKAYDFSAVAPSGQILYYNIVGNNAIVVSPNGGFPLPWQGYSKPTGNLSIPNSVTNPNDGIEYPVTIIGDAAFESCNELSSISIPNSISHIGNLAFEGCSGLTDVHIGSSVSHIGFRAFVNCNNLSSIVVEGENPYYDSRNNCNAIIITNQDCLFLGCKNTVIPNTITSIRDSAFMDCSGLTHISFPNSVVSIGDYAFYQCSGLTNLSIPNSVTSIGIGAFSKCTGLTTASISNSISYLKDGLFSYCTNLTEIQIPNSVTYIGASVFWECTSLTSITIPSRVCYIDCGAFAYCYNLTEIVSLASDAPILADYNLRYDVFYEVPDTATIIVPCGSLPSYYSTWYAIWRSIRTNFHNIFENADIMLDANPNDSTKGSIEITTIPTCQNPLAVIQATPNDGYFFNYWSDGNTDNPRTLTIDTYTNIVGYFASLENIENAEDRVVNIHSNEGIIFVDGTERKTICVYDIYGRNLLAKQEGSSSIQFKVPVSGIYIVKIGGYPARKVVVIR